jgi:hypothetical protein
MGNGALPHGPSYRAHPRLYRLGRPAMSAFPPLASVERESPRPSHRVAVMSETGVTEIPSRIK